jgi:hypothetical protein
MNKPSIRVINPNSGATIGPFGLNLKLWLILPALASCGPDCVAATMCRLSCQVPTGAIAAMPSSEIWNTALSHEKFPRSLCPSWYLHRAVFLWAKSANRADDRLGHKSRHLLPVEDLYPYVTDYWGGLPSRYFLSTCGAQKPCRADMIQVNQ